MLVLSATAQEEELTPEIHEHQARSDDGKSAL